MKFTSSSAALGRTWAFARDHNNGNRIVVAAAIAGAVLWLLLSKPAFSCDTESYFTWIVGALGHPIPSIFHTVRPSGYPLLLALFGFGRDGSHGLGLVGILAVQFAMAVAIPVLIFGALRPFHYGTALSVALLSVVSLAPFIDAELVLPNQSVKFLLVLIVYLVCAFFRSSSPRRWLAALALAYGIFCFFAPLFASIVPLIFLILLVGRPREWRAIVAAVVAVIAIIVAQNFYVSTRLLPKGQWLPAQSQSEETHLRAFETSHAEGQPHGFVSVLYRYGVAPSFGATAERLFYRIFYVDRRAEVGAENGKASREYLDYVRAYFADHPDQLAQIGAERLPPAAAADLDAFMRQVVVPARDIRVFQSVRSSMDANLGHYASFRIHADTIRETVAADMAHKQGFTYKTLAHLILLDMRAFYFGPLAELSDGGAAVQCLSDLPWRGQASSPNPAGNVLSQRTILSWFRGVLAVIIVVLFIPCLFHSVRLPMVFAAVLLAFQGLTASIYARPQIGDVDEIMPLAILLAGFMACAVARAHGARLRAAATRGAAALVSGSRRLMIVSFGEVLKFAAINLVIVAVVVIGLELLARTFLPERSPYGAVQPGQYLRYHPYLTITNESSLDTEGRWFDDNHKQYIPYHVKTNRLGFRMERELGTADKYQKAADEKVVLIFGSSPVWGFGATSNAMTIAGQLERRLNEARDGKRYTVFNMGNGAWIVYQELAALQLYGLMLDPDWIIFMDGRNDIFNIGYTFGEDRGISGNATATRDLVDGYFYKKRKVNFYRSELENELIRLSALYRFMTGKQYIPQHVGILYKTYGWEDVDQNIEFYLRVQELALRQCPTCQYILSTQPIERGGRTMTKEDRDNFVAANKDIKIDGAFIGKPDWENLIHYSFGRLKDEMPGICAAAAPRCRYQFMDDVLPEGYVEKTRYFTDDVHMNDDGYGKIAEFYASIILQGTR